MFCCSIILWQVIMEIIPMSLMFSLKIFVDYIFKWRNRCDSIEEQKSCCSGANSGGCSEKRRHSGAIGFWFWFCSLVPLLSKVELLILLLYPMWFVKQEIIYLRVYDIEHSVRWKWESEGLRFWVKCV